MTLYLESISEQQLRVINCLAPEMELRRMYLAGGTAIALQLGHRQSVDLDWFGPEPIDDPMELAQSLQYAGIDFETGTTDRGTLHGHILDVRVSFFHYVYPQLQPASSPSEIPCSLASIEDLTAMKLVAIAQRGAKKDFTDIYAIGREKLSLQKMLDAFRQKFGVDDVSRVLYSLTYFADADEEPLPTMLWKVPWDSMKDAIRTWVAEATGKT